MSAPAPRDALVAFLVAAKRRTYAAQGDEASVQPALPGSRQLEYREGPFLYRDIYFGSARFVGQETIYHDALAIWAMCYAGGIVASITPQEAEAVYRFLRAALRRVESGRPFRGPRAFREGAYAYADESEGDVDRFSGFETITRDGILIYELRYAGGRLW